MVLCGSTRSRILRIKRIGADWLFVVPTEFSPLTKVFRKGEFEGKNLFFKKGFPLIRLEKTSLKREPACWRPKVFSRRRTKSAKEASRKVREVRKEIFKTSRTSSAFPRLRVSFSGG